MVNATQSATGFVGDPTAWGAAMRGTVLRGAAMRGAMTQVAAMRGTAVQHAMALRAQWSDAKGTMPSKKRHMYAGHRVVHSQMGTY